MFRLRLWPLGSIGNTTTDPWPMTNQSQYWIGRALTSLGWLKLQAVNRATDKFARISIPVYAMAGDPELDSGKLFAVG